MSPAELTGALVNFVVGTAVGTLHTGGVDGLMLCRNDGFVDGDATGITDEGAPLGMFEVADCVANPLGLVQGTGIH